MVGEVILLTTGTSEMTTGLTTGLTTGSLFVEGRPVLFPFCLRGASLGTHDTPEPGTQPSAQAQLIPYQAPLRW